MSNVKSRAFWFVLYPESAKENWKEILKGYHISFLVSPLHDMDKNADGTTKKAHYHIMLIFPNTTTTTIPEEICNAVNGVRPPNDRGYNGFACSSISSCARYLIHRDDADKFQYSPSDVYCYGDISYLECMASNYEINNTLDDMKLFIEQHRIVSIPLFNAFCRENSPEWSYILNSQHSLKIERHIKSMNYILTEKLHKFVDYQVIWNPEAFEMLDCGIASKELLQEESLIIYQTTY